MFNTTEWLSCDILWVISQGEETQYNWLVAENNYISRRIEDWAMEHRIVYYV